MGLTALIKLGRSSFHPSGAETWEHKNEPPNQHCGLYRTAVWASQVLSGF